MTDSQGIVVPPGEGAVLDMSPGRAAALKLQSGETGDSIMVFEEAAPAGTATSYHIHHNSDEVAYVLSGEIGPREAGRIARQVRTRMRALRRLARWQRRFARLANKTAPTGRGSAKMTGNDLEQGKSK